MNFIVRLLINVSIPAVFMMQLFNGRMDYEDAAILACLAMITMYMFRRLGIWKLTIGFIPGIIYVLMCYSLQVHVAFVAVPYVVILVWYMQKYTPDEEATAKQTAFAFAKYLISIAIVCLPVLVPQYSTGALIAFLMMWGWQVYKMVGDDTMYDDFYMNEKEETYA